jgi:outer membrane lipoprotein-sorting protein
MQEKEVYSKKIDNCFFILILLILFLLNSFKINAQENDKIKELVFEYFNNIGEFSSLFLQTNNEDLSEGKLFYIDGRLRVDYTNPTNIIIIISEKKAMYYNKDLEEVEYFNPKKSIAKIFFNIFNQSKYFYDSTISNQKNFIKLNKKIFIDEDEVYKLEIIFEKNPLLLRNLKIYNDNEVWAYSIFNHDFNPGLKRKFFSMANPSLN